MEVNLIKMAMTRWRETVLDADLQKYYRVYKVKEDYDGNLVAVCGKGFFCLAFRMLPDKGPFTEEKCLRIWYKDGNLLNLRLQERSRLVSRAISRIHESMPAGQHRYFIDYDYRDRVISVNGSVLPGIIMPWINGCRLDQYIRDHNDKASLLRLAGEFMRMFRTLKMHGIAHGDLSNSNILVTPEGKIKLIDYDSVYVPTMEQYKGADAFYQITGGQAPFQHPERIDKINCPMTANDDNFSQHVIYLSILAMAHKPELVDNISDKELIFTPLDLQSGKNFYKTTIFQKIDAIDNHEVQFRLEQMAKALRGPLSAVKSIVDQNPPAPRPSPKHYVEYCTTCGHKFNNDDDLYCTQCGESRYYYVEQPNTYKVRLMKPGLAKLQVIKVVKSLLNTELTEAKDLVESAPRIIASGLTKPKAREYISLLEDAGADAVLL